MTTIQRASKKEIFGWAMFDFANSSYTTVIVTVVFSVIFPRLIVGDAPGYRTGNLLWSISLSFSYLLVLLSAPVFGAVMDYTAKKKQFLFAATVLTSAATAALYFVTPGAVFLCMALIIVSNLGFSLSEAFVSSFLTNLGPSEELGKISGYAWGFGYFGGLVSTSLVMFGLGALTMDNFPSLRFVGPITGAFFMLAAIPTFLWVREPGEKRKIPEGVNYLGLAFGRIRKTLGDVRDYRDMAILLVSFFFAYAGLSIVISFAFIYGDQIIRWRPLTQMLMFVITQLTAAAGAFFFGTLQDRWGAKRTFILTLCLWIAAVVMIHGVGGITQALNRLMGTAFETQHLFLVVGSLAGLSLGATQSSCRAMVGMFAPVSKSGEFFGLWGFTGRLAAIFGLMGLGFLQVVFGLQNAVLLCSLFFMISVAVVLFVDEKRGIASAARHEGE
jgi:UMF1 family MFS transporter